MMKLNALREYNLKKVLIAAGLSRVYEHMAHGDFAIVSAERQGSNEQDNATRTADLKESVRDLGYGFMPAVGGWKGVSENSVFIPNAKKEDAVELGKKYQQEAVIYGVDGQYWLVDIKTGTETGPSPVENQFRHLDQGQESEYYTQMKGRKWKLESPESPEVKVPAEEVRASMSVKGRSFTFSNGFDLERGGQPFFFWTGVDKFACFVPPYGFAVHDVKEGPELVTGAGTYSVRSLEVYIPFKK